MAVAVPSQLDYRYLVEAKSAGSENRDFRSIDALLSMDHSIKMADFQMEQNVRET
jgi:hypothetical protein